MLIASRDYMSGLGREGGDGCSLLPDILGSAFCNVSVWCCLPHEPFLVCRSHRPPWQDREVGDLVRWCVTSRVDVVRRQRLQQSYHGSLPAIVPRFPARHLLYLHRGLYIVLIFPCLEATTPWCSTHFSLLLLEARDILDVLLLAYVCWRTLMMPSVTLCGQSPNNQAYFIYSIVYLGDYILMSTNNKLL